MTVEIANLALERCAAPLLGRMDDKGGVGDAVRRHLMRSVRWVLKRRLWTEITTVLPLSPAQIGDTALPRNFQYAYHLPADYIRAYRLSFGDGLILTDDDWRVMNLETGSGRQRVIATRREVEHLEYVGMPTDLDALPSDVKDVVALRLAQQLITPLKVNAAERDRIEAEFKRDLMDAADVDAAQDAEEIDLSGGDIVEARLGTWSGVRREQY